MTQYKKLFDKAEVEYITPFLKLWMSFNSWYKEDLENVKFDADAIKRYKKSGKIKNAFLKFFDLSSEAGLEFKNALYELVLNLQNHPLKKEKQDGSSEDVNYEVKDAQGNKFNLILENVNRRGGKEPIFISTDKKRFQILEENKELFFQQTLEIIYQIRCNLVHGSFDIENQYFLKLVESSYKILFSIMERILQADGEFVCVSLSKNVDAKAIFDAGKMIVLAGSKVTKNITFSYSSKDKRQKLLRENANGKDNYFEIMQTIEFSSPSSASSFCLGNSSNGWKDWKNKSGKTMNDVLRNHNN